MKTRELIQHLHIDNDYFIPKNLITDFYNKMGYDVDVEIIHNENNHPSYSFKIYRVEEKEREDI